MGILQAPATLSDQPPPMPGALCPECGNATMIQKDGCDFCTACGHIGSCG
jgi:ribonucleoside-diphosphate reductase alpha chain